MGVIVRQFIDNQMMRKIFDVYKMYQLNKNKNKLIS